MATVVPYSRARSGLDSLCDEAAATREPIVIRRDGAEDVALIAIDELSGLLETAHLLRSPANARRLLTALDRARRQELGPSSVDELRRELGLEQGGHEAPGR